MNNDLLDKIEAEEEAAICLSCLDKSERRILISYYVDGKTMRQIGESINRTPENIRQRILKSKLKARNHCNLVMVTDGISKKI